MVFRRMFLPGSTSGPALAARPTKALVAATPPGPVTAPPGAPISAATVTAKNLETAAVRIATTDDAGRYLLLSLPVGQYEVRAAKAGFQDAVRSGIHLVVGQEANVHLSLQVGLVKTEIIVTEDAAMVSTSPSDISGIVGEQQVKQLPLNGRSYD